MDELSYITFAAYAEGIYTEKGSKFIACAFPVSNENEVHQAMLQVKEKYPKARHYCFAYQLQDDYYRASDDGEPSGTAGKPIHNQLRSHQLTDALIVVVRYFGGVLLGSGGLVTAYKTAAGEAIQNANLITKQFEDSVSFSFYFTELNEVMKIAKQKSVEIVSKKIENECVLSLRYPRHLATKVQKQLDKISGLRFL
ncbi:MAG TPA: YigZ family protein [Bacteroidia bacterium]|nr:YigZ family protein [Bacteroidia bacterium]